MGTRVSLIAMTTGILAFWPSASLAYIGPGAGLSAIGTFIALVGAVVLAIIGFVWYPVKRLVKTRKSRKAMSAEQK